MDAAATYSPSGLSAPAAAFEFGVVWAVVGTAIVLGPPSDVQTHDWAAFAILLPLVAGVHLLAREREKHQGSHLSLAPMFAAALLLPPLLAVAVIAAAFAPEWVRTRVAWYIVLFNVANFVGPALAARAVFDATATGGSAAWTAGALAAIVTFLALQYGVLAVMLRLARDVPPRETIRVDCVLIDAGLLSLGALGAALADEHAALVVLLGVPLALTYRSLELPTLVEASRIEPKTGLYNMRHFGGALEHELHRADRFDRPLALLMIDVDHLRQINTGLGHVVGDRALRLVAATLRIETRDYDVAARFGGDEFCVLLPETDAEAARGVAERIRSGVERAGTANGLKLTVSVGVGVQAGPGMHPDELLAQADRAAYRAKFSGRNAVAYAPVGDPVGEAERVLAEAAVDPAA